VSASVLAVIPDGGVMDDRPLCVKAPTSSVGVEVVVSDVVSPLELRVIAPALAWTGCAASTPVYDRTDPTAPVGPGPENV
jgi:hypothetical protein